MGLIAPERTDAEHHDVTLAELRIDERGLAGEGFPADEFAGQEQIVRIVRVGQQDARSNGCRATAAETATRPAAAKTRGRLGRRGRRRLRHWPEDRHRASSVAEELPSAAGCRRRPRQAGCRRARHRRHVRRRPGEDRPAFIHGAERVLVIAVEDRAGLVAQEHLE